MWDSSAMVKKLKVSYFPKEFILVTPIAILLAAYFYYSYYPLTAIIICSVGILAGILAITTFYITEFDLKREFYKDYILILGFGFNYIKKGLKKIDRIIISPAYNKRTVRFPGAQPYQVNSRKFTALLIHDGDELALMTMKSKKKLIKESKNIAHFFKIDIEDRSVRDPYVIDLKKI
jgi:hypothetical protein